MKCVICGTEIAEGSSFCSHCGTRITSPDIPELISSFDYCPECGERVDGNTQFCPKCGAAIKAQGPTVGTSYRSMPVPETIREPEQYALNVQDNPVYPMKWHKFLIYFLLFFNAAVNLFSAYVYFTGRSAIPGAGTSLHVYNLVPFVAVMDKIYAAVLLVLAVCFIVVRMKMAQFRKDAPELYILLLIVNAAAALVYMFALSILVSGFMSMSIWGLAEIIGRVIGAAIMVIANHIYYKKRKSMFIR